MDTRAHADLIFHSGKVLTVDARFSISQAVAIRNGLILATGSNAEVLKTAGARTRTIDLAGKTVLPGLYDGHAHMDREGLKTLYPSLQGARSIADILKRIAAEVENARPGEWIVTMPVGDPPYYQDVPGILAEKRLPDRWELDTVSPDNPVYIRGIWGYWGRPPIVSIANSCALRLAGVTRDTRAPYDGVSIMKDARGEPSGVFSESDFVPTLEFSLMKVVPRFDHALRVRGLRESLRRYNAAGTTSIYEGHGIADETVRAYRELRARDALSVRSHLVVSPTPGRDIAADVEEKARGWTRAADGPGYGDAMLRMDGIFIQIGGNPDVARVLGAAAPYTGWGSYYYNALTQAQFRDIAFTAARHAIRVNTIAHDQRSVDESLAVFEKVNREVPLGARRWVISHLGPMTPANIETMLRLGLAATVIPAQTVWKNGALRSAQLAGSLRDYYAPYKSILDAGVPLVLASDNVPPRPFFILWSAISRRSQTGQVLVPSQKLSREQALRAMTINGAWLSFEEKLKGSIEPGKYADLVVIREDYLAIAVDRIKDIAPLMTLVGGRIVFDDS